MISNPPPIVIGLQYVRARRAPRLDPAGSMSVRDAAQRLSIKQGKLFAWLNENGWIARNIAAKQWGGFGNAIERGWLENRRKYIGYQRYVSQVMVTTVGFMELTGVLYGVKEF